jgi:putative hydrolase of the HAD superfamily
LWAIRERILGNEPGLKHRISALRRRVLFHALEDAGYTHAEASDLADQSFEVFLHARHQLEIFPEVAPTLETLARHYALGVVTNGNADVRRLGLADYFKFALCAEDIGIAKPDARLFHEALQRGGATAQTAVHIGDHPGDDIAGAQQAGLRAIWFNPAGKVWEAEKAPDAEIRSLTELPALLARWSATKI